jgi:signal transduction histidine kinase
MINRFSHISLIRLAGLIIWLILSIPLVITIILNSHWFNSKSILWLASHLTFGLGFLVLTKALGQGNIKNKEWLLLFALMAVTFIINWSTASVTGVFYFLILTILLPWLMSIRNGTLVLVIQFILIAWQQFTINQHLTDYQNMPLGTYILLLLMFGISIFSYVLSLIAFRQQNAKEELRKLNSELRATQVLLAESSRINERLRISRELHDLIGHHLTALSLNLEVATHISQGKVKQHIEKSQGIARLLLSDVRNVVSSFRNKGNLNFAQAIYELTNDIPRLQIHIDIDDEYTIEDPKLAQTMLRCTQEIITNCIKHANAQNLWLDFSKDNDNIRIVIKDDGIGISHFKEGNGLKGIRERVKQFNGTCEYLDIGQGFCITIIFRVN